MTTIKIYASLSTAEVSEGQNLLESTKYYRKGLLFTKILNKLYKNDIGYSIISGYRGSIFNEDNRFDSCKIRINKAEDMDKVERILATFNDLVETNISSDILTIQLRG